MTLKEIKIKMMVWRDFHGADLQGSSDIKSAKTKNELIKILEQQNRYLEDQLLEEKSALNSFRKELGL